MGLFNCSGMGKRDEQVILLAADAESRINNRMPNCLMLTEGGRTIIESQVQSLGLYNFDRKNITIVIGEQGPWKNNNIPSNLIADGVKVITNQINNKTSSAYSLELALRSLPSSFKGDVIIIYSDIIFSTQHLDIIFSNTSNCALTRRVESLTDSGWIVNQSNSKFPWQVFHGIIKISITDLKKINFSKKVFSNALDAVESVTTIKFIEHDIVNQGITATSMKTFDLNGGSFARLSKKLVVRKEAVGPGADKLINELLWLKQFGRKYPDIFPMVISSEIEEEKVWYEMPYFELPNIRKAILTFQISEDVVVHLVERILKFNFENLYSNLKGKPNPNWIKEAHYDRVYYRLFEVYNYSSDYKELISKQYLVINGKKYKNLIDCFCELLRIIDLENLLMPDYLRDIHGDLHFQNILFTEDLKSFVLADPRGEINGSDLFYDLGKLSHSINGKYDLLHTNQFELIVNSDGGILNCELKPINKEVFDIYESLKAKIFGLLEILPEVKSISLWREKMLFNECMHFCSVMTFHLNRYGDENRSMAMYLTGVILLNEFLENSSIQNLPKAKEPKYYFKDRVEFLSQLELNNAKHEL